jgi:hypothetical protein
MGMLDYYRSFIGSMFRTSMNISRQTSVMKEVMKEKEEEVARISEMHDERRTMDYERCKEIHRQRGVDQRDERKRVFEITARQHTIEWQRERHEREKMNALLRGNASDILKRRNQLPKSFKQRNKIREQCKADAIRRFRLSGNQWRLLCRRG